MSYSMTETRFNKKPLANSAWQWWRLNVLQQQAERAQGEAALLSRHVLNLRADLLPPALQEEQALKPPIKKPVWQPNFKKTIYGLNSHYRRWLEKLSGQHYQLVRDLSVLTAVEVLLWLTEAVWFFLLAGFLRLHEEATPLVRSIKDDLKEFKRLLIYSFILPWRLIKNRGHLQSGDYRHYHKELNWSSYPKAKRYVWVQAGAFLLMALVFTLPFKVIATWQDITQRQRDMMSLSQLAVDKLKNGAAQLGNGDIDSAQDNFSQAASTFDQASELLRLWPDQVMFLLTKLPGKPQQYAAGQYLLSASKEVSQAAAQAVAAWRVVTGTTSPEAAAQLGDTLQTVQNTLQQVKPHLDKANAYLDKVDPTAVPPELQDRFSSLREQLKQLDSLLDYLIAFPGFLQKAISSSQPKTYVVVFQNNSELRPTGGFIGSLAFLQVVNGQVTNLTIPGGGPYDFQGSLKQVIAPPDPLRLVRGTWQLQDANWWFNWPTSASKILWFIEQSGGPSADGVIALTPDLVIGLLQLTGPIDLPAYGKIITADNFMRETQLAVDVEYDKSVNRPKQFIADLTPILVNRLLQLPASTKAQALALLEKSLISRSLQFFVTDNELEKALQTYGWSGEIKHVPYDYLAVVRTNIGGGKTDLVTRDQITHQVEITSDGQMVIKVTMTRQHQGAKSDIFTSRRNVDYLRFYVPRGSTLIQANGFTPPPANYFKPVPTNALVDQDLQLNEDYVATDQPSGTRITEEFGKTVFANWLSVSPGETKTVTLIYRLPFVLRSDLKDADLRRYQVYFQRQAGVGRVSFTSQVDLPTDWQLRWQASSASLRKEDSTISFSSDLTTDAYYGLLLQPPPRDSN